jgi:hypothetical protein
VPNWLTVSADQRLTKSRCRIRLGRRVGGAALGLVVEGSDTQNLADLG